MEVIIIHKRSFTDAFRQAEIDTSHTVNNAFKLMDSSGCRQDAIMLEGVHKALAKLKERLIES